MCNIFSPININQYINVLKKIKYSFIFILFQAIYFNTIVCNSKQDMLTMSIDSIMEFGTCAFCNKAKEIFVFYCNSSINNGQFVQGPRRWCH